jgi:dienelactone hydrolase
MMPMATLDTRPRLAGADAIYAMLVDAHRDLTEAQSERVNVRLVLLLANHIGDQHVIAEAIAAARAEIADAVH